MWGSYTFFYFLRVNNILNGSDLTKFKLIRNLANCFTYLKFTRKNLIKTSISKAKKKKLLWHYILKNLILNARMNLLFTTIRYRILLITRDSLENTNWSFWITKSSDDYLLFLKLQKTLINELETSVATSKAGFKNGISIRNCSNTLHSKDMPNWRATQKGYWFWENIIWERILKIELAFFHMSHHQFRENNFSLI